MSSLLRRCLRACHLLTLGDHLRAQQESVDRARISAEVIGRQSRNVQALLRDLLVLYRQQTDLVKLREVSRVHRRFITELERIIRKHNT